MSSFIIISIFLLVSLILPLLLTFLIIRKNKVYKYFTFVSFFSLIFAFITLFSGLSDKLGYFKFKNEVYDLETLLIIYYYIFTIPIILIFILSLLFWINNYFKNRR